MTLKDGVTQEYNRSGWFVSGAELATIERPPSLERTERMQRNTTKVFLPTPL